MDLFGDPMTDVIDTLLSLSITRTVAQKGIANKLPRSTQMVNNTHKQERK